MTRLPTFFKWLHALRTRTAWPFVVAALLSGCAHSAGPQFRNGSGDAGTFIVRQAVLRGAEPLTTEQLPQVSSSWTYAKDDSGVIIRLPAKEHAAIEALLLRAFGTPSIGPVDTVDGRRAGAYRLTRKGATLQFARDWNCTQVIVLREWTQKDNAADFLRRLQ
jgi:hypothetical protein